MPKTIRSYEFPPKGIAAHLKIILKYLPYHTTHVVGVLLF